MRTGVSSISFQSSSVENTEVHKAPGWREKQTANLLKPSLTPGPYLTVYCDT